MSKSDVDPFEPGSPLEQALHFLSDAMVGSHGRPEAASRLRAEAESVEADRGGFDVSRISSAWQDILGRVVHRPRSVRRRGLPDSGEFPFGSEPEHPEKRELADAIRACPMIPQELVEYVAGRLDGTVSPPANRPKKDPAQGKWVTTLDRAYQVRVHQAAFRLQGIRGPKTRAIDAVAKLRGKAPETIKKSVEGGLKSVPAYHRNIVPSIAEAEKFLRELESEGSIRLDSNDGLVWLTEGPD